jgi:glutamate--cysteine ligase
MPNRLTLGALFESYHAHHQPRERWLIGGEYERALVRGDGRSVGYFEENGIRWLLGELQARLGWEAKSEDGNVVELRGEGASITLEPGGQVELSGAPFRTLGQVAAEVRRNRQVLYEVVEGRDLHWVAAGLTPYARMDDISFMPKGRYAMMQQFLPQYGDLAHWMMKGTCCVQVNLDFDSEADCAAKFHTSLDLAPLNVAAFANSPIGEGRELGWMSYRGHIWSRVDPRRTGFPAAVSEGYSHAGWVEYLLDTPMMFHYHEGRWRPSEGRTFRQWLTTGIEGQFPTAADWALHQTSVFPEVRVKRTLEIRSADAVPVELAIAFCALWTGALYGALAESRDFAAAFRAANGGRTREEGFAYASLLGLAGDWGGRPLAAWAGELGAIAQKGLVRIGEDTRLLDPFLALTEGGVSPGQHLLDAFRLNPAPANVLRAAAY